MTANQLNLVIGQTALIQFENLQITCTVWDAKMSYGRARLLIRPATGRGEQWVEMSRVVGFMTNAADVRNLPGTALQR